MTYYIFIQDEKINGTGECQCLNENILNIEVSEEIYNDIEKYIYKNGEIIENANYEQEQIKKEKERIALLKLTRGDVFRGLLQAKGITKTQIKQLIEAMPEETPEEVIAKELARIDFEDALEFYRGNPLVETLGLQLGITSEQLDNFFLTNDYKTLGE